MMMNAKDGKTYFDRELLNKFKHQHNFELQSILENVNLKVLIDSNGKTLLHYSVLFDNKEMVEYLISRGCNVDVQDYNLDTPLMIAVERKNCRLMGVLLAAKADIFICNKLGQSPLKIGFSFYALMHIEIVMMLIEAMKEKCSNNIQKMAKIVLEIPNNDIFPTTILFKNTALTEFMLRNGCDVYDIDCLENTALHYAVKCMDFENVKLLVKFKSDVNAENWNLQRPLHFYKFGGEENYEILFYLLNNGAYVESNDEDGNSLASRTFQYEKFEHVKVLLDCGVNLCKLNEDSTLLHYLARNKNPGVIELLQDKNFDPNVRDWTGKSALFAAVDFSNYNSVEFLLKKGADPNITDVYGKTVLRYSIAKRICPSDSRSTATKYLDFIELLLEYGAKVHETLRFCLQNYAFETYYCPSCYAEIFEPARLRESNH